MKKFLILLTLALTIPVAHASFDDSAEHLHDKGISFLQFASIVDGYDDGTFRPDNPINRAEMLKILVEAEDADKGYTLSIAKHAIEDCFDDVPVNDWFTKYVCYFKAEGRIVGYDGGTNFRPGQNVTFVEGLKMALETFDYGYAETPDTWYQGPVEYAAARNLIPVDIYDLDTNLTRGQMSDLVTRILKYNIDPEGGEFLSTYLGDLDNETFQVTFDTISRNEDKSDLYLYGAICIQSVPDCGNGFFGTRDKYTCEAICPEQGTLVCTDIGRECAAGQQAAKIEGTCELYCPEDDVVVLEDPVHTDYTTATLATALAKGRTLLYFRADWCPTCRSLDNELASDLSALPDDLTILDIDYDTEKSLKQTWGIVLQHTLVQLDKNGEEVKRWTGGGISTINAELASTEVVQSQTFTITFSDTGVSAPDITINSGDTVQFLNLDMFTHWPATDNHPSHRNYPNSSISKCSSDLEYLTFDACAGLPKDEMYSFTFSEVGYWTWHDHLDPSLIGSITVQ
ncbi:S-layer homology domain-containing protein [Candidatus Gracilibacteria bacterium]|nr:S-layer homology domain-containing protein [Candidatus Gracilibacteria bacterium]